MLSSRTHVRTCGRRASESQGSKTHLRIQPYMSPEEHLMLLPQSPVPTYPYLTNTAGAASRTFVSGWMLRHSPPVLQGMTVPLSPAGTEIRCVTSHQESRSRKSPAAGRRVRSHETSTRSEMASRLRTRRKLFRSAAHESWKSMKKGFVAHNLSAEQGTEGIRGKNRGGQQAHVE